MQSIWERSKKNGRTNFEKFVSKEELYQSIKELQSETVKLNKTKTLSADKLEYLTQIKNDIKDAERLIEISC